jgi:hypothetical protein
MHEADAAGQAVAGRLVNQIDALALQLGQVTLDVVGLKSHVMQPALPFQETGDSSALAHRLQQLQLAVTEMEKGSANALVFHNFVSRSLKAEDPAVEGGGIVNARDDYPYVVNTLDQVAASNSGAPYSLLQEHGWIELYTRLDGQSYNSSAGFARTGVGHCSHLVHQPRFSIFGTCVPAALRRNLAPLTSAR